MSHANAPWYRELNRYHWFVLIVCTLGWVFDCFDQQLFALARKPAVAELMGISENAPQVAEYTGYAIYFPALFPTRLRSTGTSFCYNIGRYVAALGPSLLGLLTTYVFTTAKGYDEPMRYAGLSMCGIFLLGLVVLIFLPETKDKPLPE